MDARSGLRKVRLAYVVSHPIQYQADLLRAIAADPAIDLCVFFCSDFSARAYKDEGFGVDVAWDVPLLSGYRYVVLPRWRDTPSPSTLSPISRGFYRHLRRGIDGQAFDVVWVHGYSSINTLHAMLAAKALGIPVLTRSDSWLGDRSRSRVRLAIEARVFPAAGDFGRWRTHRRDAECGILGLLYGRRLSFLPDALRGQQRLLCGAHGERSQQPRCRCRQRWDWTRRDR